MSKTVKISIITGVSVLCIVVIVLWTGRLLLGPMQVSSVPIPGSSMTAIVTSDISGCYSVQLFDHGQPISNLRLLGPYASQKCTLDKVTSVSNIVTIDWSDGYHYSVAVDIIARRFVTDSNSVPSK
ncbi:MAG TPA: hypothetical protein VK742_09205 [Candidatus Sulfotelmatobacter sp.]|jgi:hypothetical protein|nr:hypothetical protein [Candidatus Sulfotelmatobacter sp.]